MELAKKPDWWPPNPYPPDLFPGTRDDFKVLVPDDKVRAKIVGILGRVFWDIASETIWDRIQQNSEALIALFRRD